MYVLMVMWTKAHAQWEETQAAGEQHRHALHTTTKHTSSSGDPAAYDEVGQARDSRPAPAELDMCIVCVKSTTILRT